MTQTNKKWTEQATETLLTIVGSETPVSASTVEKAADELGFSTRSISSKLRRLDRDVVSLAKDKTATFSEGEGLALKAFVEANANQLTYREISEQFEGGKFGPKQVQGKLLALELTSMVKPAEKVEVARQYSDAEEVRFVEMANAGAFIEDIAQALGKEIASVRGKALSLVRKEQIAKIPAQRESHSKVAAIDPVEALGSKIAEMTVAEIAAAVDKTERGLRTMLTRRGIDCADYKGSQKKAKAEAKAAA